MVRFFVGPNKQTNKTDEQGVITTATPPFFIYVKDVGLLRTVYFLQMQTKTAVSVFCGHLWLGRRVQVQILASFLPQLRRTYGFHFIPIH